LATFALQSNFKAPAYWAIANKLIPLSLSLSFSRSFEAKLQER